ncbi:nickel-dependent lactate racemase [Paenibacillus sp. KR2-11]
MPELRYGRGIVSVELPDSCSWDLLSYPGMDLGTSHALSIQRMRHALQHPAHARPLREQVQSHHHVVILISDGTRACPSPLLLPLLLEELNAGGVPDEQIDIVVALGAHRRHTPKELLQLVGETVASRVKVHNHSSDSEDCRFMGTTSRGTPVEINRLVADATFRIATGSIQPHALAGMSGGVKALVPGAASRRTIEYNHGLSLKYQTQAGETDNPIYADMVEAQAFVPLHFLLNVVLNHNNEVLDAFAGDLSETHRLGSERAAEHFLLPVRDLYDLLIVSPGGDPKDLQLYQALKSLRNAAAFTRPGGQVLLLAECREMLGSGALQSWLETMTDLERSTSALKEHFVLGAHKLLHIEEIVNRVQVYLYSSLPSHWADMLGFTLVDRLNEQIASLTQTKTTRIAIMPYGALTFPMPEQGKPK